MPVQEFKPLTGKFAERGCALLNSSFEEVEEVDAKNQVCHLAGQVPRNGNVAYIELRHGLFTIIGLDVRCDF